MVKIRLARFGKKNQPSYRLVIIKDRTKREGQALETVGSYNPLTKPSTIKLDKEKIEQWLKNGAQPTDTVRYLLIKEGILKKDKNKKVFKKEPGKKKQERQPKPEVKVEEKAKEEVVVEAKQEVKEEPVEEVKQEVAVETAETAEKTESETNS